jgi:PRTRC genetic system protein E
MFQELHPLLKQRSLTITIAALNGEQIRVNIIPHSRPEDSKANGQIKYSHKDEVAEIPEAAVKALATPISLTGTPEDTNS